MNKKFSTLLAGAALLGAVTANGAVKLNQGANNGLYQLKAGSAFLSITENSTTHEDEIKMVSHSSANLGGTMWCVTVDAENQGQNPKYDFTNKIGKFLGLEISTIKGKAAAPLAAVPAVVGGDLSGWKFSPVFKNGVEKSVLYSYFTNDSVIGLKVNTSGDVEMVKTIATTAGITAAGFTEFELVEAASIVVSGADELNTIFGTQDKKAGITLKFTPDVLGDGAVNYFTEKKFTVEASGTANYFHVLRADSSYLYVDTAYTNAVGGAKFLAYNWSNLKDTYKTGTKNHATPKDSINATDLSDQYKFMFTYWPSNDSLEIQVKQSLLKTSETYWKDVTATTAMQNQHISLQELLKDKVRILTVDAAQNTKIELGFAGCKVLPTTKTTVDDGVYVIRNAKTGKYYAAPLYNESASSKYEWVTLDIQDAAHMPAYQWVVTKTLSTATSLATSPITITNREFPDKKWNNVQLRLNEKGEIIASSSEFNNVTFDQIKDSTIIKDKKLGYKYLSNNELIVNKYKFNYLNPFTQDYWIANGADKDSLIYVKQDANEYILTEGSTAEYGIDVDATLLKKIPGLAQLERTNYVIAKNKTAKLVKAYGSKYSMGAANYGTVAEVDTFFFKENNHYDGKHYYAILETAYDNTKHAAYIADLNKETSKVGIADDGMTAGLKVQLLNESRTSAFTVEPSDAPLYRRFNKAVLGEDENDGPDSLLFVEKYRGEYLMDEGNGSFTDEFVDYLGIWNKERAENKLAMRIDTAWLNRGAGNVKPQYLISVARDDQGAIETIPCDEADDKHFYIDDKGVAHKTDKWHCQHAKQGRTGFAYGKYLVSFADSARMKDSNTKPWMDITNGYTRVGFVKAVHAGDSLFILVNEFKNMKPADLDTADIVKAYTAAKINGKYIVNLQGDQHKNVTWSFRYVDPDKAANVTEEDPNVNAFMFESNVYTDEKLDTPDYDAVAGAQKNIPLSNVHGLGNAIAPNYAAWLKMQNGCLVLTRYDSDFNSSKTGGDAALVFNVAQKTDADDMVTSIDGANTEGVSVVATNGAVTVQGAAGKSVVITNILGKVVAETVLSSDNATIAVPAGIVAVAVDGEEAVKVVVK